MTKGELMKKVYSEKELGNVDSAIPAMFWPMLDTSEYVMDYNENNLGRLTNLYAKLWHKENKASHYYVTVLDFVNGKVETFKYTDKDLEKYEGDLESWLVEEKGFNSSQISYMAMDNLYYEIHP